MQPSGVRLGIDYGSATTAAVLAFGDGRIVPLPIEGAATIPSGVLVQPDTGHLVAGLQALHLALDWPDCYLSDPRRHITTERVQVAGREVATVDLVAATLRQVAGEAARAVGGPVSHAVITVPPGWGPRRRTLLQDAASRAGLTRADLVADPVAAVAWLHGAAPLGDGACVLVCDAGATAIQVTVVQRDDHAWQILATTAPAGSGGRDVDDAIAAHAASTLAAGDPQAWDRLRHPTSVAELRDHRLLWEAARQAKHVLWHAPSTIVALPAPHPPVVVDHQQLGTLVEPLLKNVPAAVDDALAAADVDRASITAAVRVGGGARLPGLAEAIAAHTGLSPTVADRPDQVLAEGALRATTNLRVRPGLPPSYGGEPPHVRLRLRNAGAPIVFLAASLAVLAQALFGADVYPRQPQPTVVTNNAGFGVAALCAVLTALAAAHMVSTGGVAVDTAAPAMPAPAWGLRLIAKSYAGAAALGVTVAAIYGLLAGAYFGLADNPYLRWSLLAAMPVAVIAVATALLATRVPGDVLAGWLPQTGQPVIPVVLAAAGVLTMWASLSVSPSILPMGSALGRLGAAATGIAIALTVTRAPLLRLIVGTVLAVGAAAVFTLANNAIIEIAYIAAVTWWWLIQLIRTARTAVPYALPALRRWLGRVNT